MKTSFLFEYKGSSLHYIYNNKRNNNIEFKEINVKYLLPIICIINFGINFVIVNGFLF